MRLWDPSRTNACFHASVTVTAISTPLGPGRTLPVSSALREFALKHARNTLKRIFYNYFLRNFSIASYELLAGLLLVLFGTCIGVVQWSRSIATGQVATSWTVMLAALPIVVGVQFLTAFFASETQDIPRTPIQREAGFPVGD